MEYRSGQEGEVRDGGEPDRFPEGGRSMYDADRDGGGLPEEH